MFDDVPDLADWTTPTLVGSRLVDDGAGFDDVPYFVDWATQNRGGRHLAKFGDTQFSLAGQPVVLS